MCNVRSCTLQLCRATKVGRQSCAIKIAGVTSVSTKYSLQLVALYRRGAIPPWTHYAMQPSLRVYILCGPSTAGTHHARYKGSEARLPRVLSPCQYSTWPLLALLYPTLFTARGRVTIQFKLLSCLWRKIVCCLFIHLAHQVQLQ